MKSDVHQCESTGLTASATALFELQSWTLYQLCLASDTRQQTAHQTLMCPARQGELSQGLSSARHCDAGQHCHFCQFFCHVCLPFFLPVQNARLCSWRVPRPITSRQSVFGMRTPLILACCMDTLVVTPKLSDYFRQKLPDFWPGQTWPQRLQSTLEAAEQYC